jgi:uncharacterized protein (DUF1697 family)
MDVIERRASDGTEITTYVALLRGINVGGHRLIKMPELQRLFEAMGFGRVRTYIQSGNVVFTSAADDPPEPLRQRIEREIAARFGFPVTVVLRTAAALERIITDCPFAAGALAEGENLYLALLADAPSLEGVERLRAYDGGSDEARVAGREVYLLYRRSMRDTPLTNAFLERTLGVAATTRNWRTMRTLAEMASATEA